MHHSNVAPLVRLEKIRHSSFQTATNENAVVDVIEEDSSKCVDVTWSIVQSYAPVLLFFSLTRTSCGWSTFRDVLFSMAKSLWDKLAKALSLGANRVKSPPCFSRSIRSATSIRDRKILHWRGKRKSLAWSKQSPVTSCDNDSVSVLSVCLNGKTQKKLWVFLLVCYFNPVFIYTIKKKKMV